MRITKRDFQEDQLSHKLFLTIRQKTKTKNASANNMLMDIKLSKSQLPKIIQSNIFLGKKLGNLGKKKDN